MLDHLERVLVSEPELNARVDALAADITQTYEDVDELTVISIINGAIPFTADLIRRIPLPLRMDCMRVSSYRDSTSPVSRPNIIDTLRLDIRQRHVILIDDILDTGRTFSHVVEVLRTMNPESLRLCVLLEKKGRRETSIKADYVGFQIPDEFVVGYGLDFAERYRNLNCIGILRPEFQNPPTWR